MSKRTIIPFGPQHPVLPEPIHLDLVLEDEKVVQAIPRIGYVHRGLEKLVEKQEYANMVYVAERICGICSFIHAQTCSQAIEDLLPIEVPERALYLRTIWAEMSRTHSHLLWLGLMADAFGFEALFMHCWRLREKILDMVEDTAGGRVIFGSCKVGGVRVDIEDAKLKDIVIQYNDLEKEIKEITDVFVEDYSVKHRLVDVGVMSKEDAHVLGAVGPTMRGSGVAKDMRTLGYAAYKYLKFEPVVETAGDCYARTKVRIREVFQSIDLIRQAVAQIPGGPIAVKVTGNPTGSSFQCVEQARGDVAYYLKANGTKNLERFRVRTPTFANIPPLLKMLGGCELADVPVIVLSIDPCISCTER
ncbi:MAG: nickel-dependent hydrogenase large subunit [Heliobacteriaceae bacterium]|nr:nickel-dependent hydrogenase large subunit [Heliobacteriaceae bacterium]MDD4587035.1 nickel-dependent hydrogenase large subunit [Heliobacteriaceae bacterium]